MDHGHQQRRSQGTKVTFFVYEVGSQLRYYVTGNFRRGMHVGAEILYLHVNGSLDSVTGVAQGPGARSVLRLEDHQLRRLYLRSARRRGNRYRRNQCH
jgi:predicted RNA-binding protein with PUA-like domain